MTKNSEGKVDFPSYLDWFMHIRRELRRTSEDMRYFVLFGIGGCLLMAGLLFVWGLEDISAVWVNGALSVARCFPLPVSCFTAFRRSCSGLAWFWYRPFAVLHLLTRAPLLLLLIIACFSFPCTGGHRLPRVRASPAGLGGGRDE